MCTIRMLIFKGLSGAQAGKINYELRIRNYELGEIRWGNSGTDFSPTKQSPDGW